MHCIEKIIATCSMIHVADTRVSRRVGEYFTKHIEQLKKIEKRVKALQVSPAPAGAATGRSRGYERRYNK